MNFQVDPIFAGHSVRYSNALTVTYCGKVSYACHAIKASAKPHQSRYV